MRRVVSLEGFGLPRTQIEQAPKRFRQWLDQLRDPPTYGEYASLDEVVRLLVRRNRRLPLERAQFIAETWFRRCDDGVVRQVADPAHKLVNPYLYRREEAELCWSCITRFSIFCTSCAISGFPAYFLISSIFCSNSRSAYNPFPSKNDIGGGCA